MIGNIIKKLREENNITQADLAKHLNISASTVGMYETNSRKPDAEMIVKIADFFGVTTDYLLGKETQLDNVSVAFSSITEGLSKEQVDDVRRYIEFLKSKEK